MKELLLQFAQYNRWANKSVCDLLLTTSTDILEAPMKGSFPNIKSTIVHIWSAENIWLQRLQLVEHPKWEYDNFGGTIREAVANWETSSVGLVQFVEKQYNDQAFSHVLAYYDLSKRHHKIPVSKILMHVFNHSTSHRGQVITLLRQADVTQIPGTDFILF